MTRSVPLMTKVPLSVMSGSSPRYTSCSRTSLTGFLAPGASLSRTMRRTLTRKRGGVGEAAQLAFLDVEHRLAEPVAHVLQGCVAAVAGNREHALECGVQSDALARLFRLVDLQELAIRIELNGQQVRRVENARLLAKILADALFLGEGISHRVVTSGSTPPQGGRDQQKNHARHQISRKTRPLRPQPPPKRRRRTERAYGAGGPT